MATPDDLITTTPWSEPAPYRGSLMQHAVIGGCSIYRLWFPRAGLMSDRHRHTYQHALLVAYGAIRLSVAGTVREITAPAIVRVKAGYVHDYTALVDGTVCYCIVPDLSRLTAEQRREIEALETSVGIIESVPADGQSP